MDDEFKTLGVGFFFGFIFGILVTIGAGMEYWNSWCIKNNYAHYDAQTGKIVYVEKIVSE